MGIFGWSYPPGAALDPSAPYNQKDPPCEVCGRFESDCICPECPVCHTIGNAVCYQKHGLERSDAQVESLREAEARWAADAAAIEDAYAYRKDDE